MKERTYTFTVEISGGTIERSDYGDPDYDPEDSLDEIEVEVEEALNRVGRGFTAHVEVES